MLLALVDLLDGLEQRHRLLHFVGGLGQRLDVLGEAGATVAAARIDEVIADARVAADAVTHLFDVGVQLLGQIGHLVDKADLGGEHGVGRILGQLGAAHVHEDHLVLLTAERAVALPHQAADLVGVGADHDARPPAEVIDGRPFLEKFRVGTDIEGLLGATLGQGLRDGLTNPVGGAHRHGGLVDDDLVALHVLTDGARHAQHIVQVGAAILVRGRADGDELQGGKGHGQGRIGGEVQTAGLDVAGDQGFQARLVDRDVALFQTRDLVLVDVHADHVVSCVGQTGACHQADVARSKDGDIHAVLCSSDEPPRCLATQVDASVVVVE